MNYLDTLKSIGLSDKEASLYLTALPLGYVSVLSLSEKTGFHRATVTELLESLLAQGVFLASVIGKRTMYAAADPKSLLGLFKQREEQFKTALPELSALAGLGIAKPKILYYEGKDQVRSLYWACLEAHQKEILTYFPSRFMAELLGKRDMEEAIRERARRKIRSRTLRAEIAETSFETSEDHAAALREVRYITPTQAPHMGIVIFDNTVDFFSPIEECYGMQVESESFASLMRCFFEGLWVSAHN